MYRAQRVAACERCKGAGKLSIDGAGNTSRVLQVDPGGKRPGTVVEESHLQDHRAPRRHGARVFQVVELARTARRRLIGVHTLHACELTLQHFP